MATIDKKFITNLQGKDFITYDGLIDLAHKEGLTRLESEMVTCDTEKEIYIFKATATFKVPKSKDVKVFTSYGDSTKANVKGHIAVHMIRMADTRAKARCLRDALNVGMCSVEELGDTVKPKPGPVTKPIQTPSKDLVCSECPKAISQRVHDYSKEKLGKVLCMPCQEKAKKEEV